MSLGNPIRGIFFWHWGSGGIGTELRTSEGKEERLELLLLSLWLVSICLVFAPLCSKVSSVNPPSRKGRHVLESRSLNSTSGINLASRKSRRFRKSMSMSQGIPSRLINPVIALAPLYIIAMLEKLAQCSYSKLIKSMIHWTGYLVYSWL